MEAVESFTTERYIYELLEFGRLTSFIDDAELRDHII